MGETESSGPLCGVRVAEFASLAPAPFAACLLADMGADVVVLDRVGPGSPFSSPLLARGKRSVAVDLKNPTGVATARAIVGRADILVEGFRPGVMERLGLGPEVCLGDNPPLVYGRMTGFGQDGPLAHAAGHDINYISLAGALGRIGRYGAPPTPPLNLVGDFGGGSLFLAFGLVCALLEARASGRGQIVDASMVDGSALLMLPFFGRHPEGEPERPARGTGLLDSGAPFYDAYETADGEWVSVGAIEPQFYAALLGGLGLDPASLPDQMDSSAWPAMKLRFAEIFRTRSRDEWCAVFEGTDACFSPVLSLEESFDHPHNRARGAHIDVDGIVQPAPAPRFSVTPGRVRRPPPGSGEHTVEILAEWCAMEPDAIAELHRVGAVR